MVKKPHVLPVIILVILTTISVHYEGFWTLTTRKSTYFQYPALSSYDNSLHIPFMYKLKNPGLYEKDFFLNRQLDIYSPYFFYLLGYISIIFPSVESMYRYLAIGLNWVFITGLYFLYLKITGDVYTSFAACCLVIVIEIFPVPGSIEWGLFLPAHVIPRGVIRAIFPYLFILFLGSVHSWKSILFYGGLGCLTLIHPISAVHISATFGLTHLLMWTTGKTRIKHLLPGTILFLVGASPYITRYLANWSASQSVPVNILIFRTPYLFLQYAGMTSWIVYVAVLVILAITGLWKYRQERLHIHQVVPRFLVSTVLVATTVMVSNIYPIVRQVQPLRVLQYLYPFLIVYAFLGIKIFPLTGLKRKSGYLLIGFLLVTIIPGYYVVTNQLEDNKVGAIKEYSKPVFSNPVGQWEQFLELCSWCEKFTSRDALFLVPPNGMAVFRVYSKRGLVVSYKDGCTSAFDANYATKWYNNYNQVMRAYEKNRLNLLNFTAKHFNADYMIVKNSFPTAIDYTIVHKNNNYTVYKVKQEPG